MAKELFRKAALERLSSPEQLDQLVQVTTPAGWVAMLAAGVLLACGVLWSILGYIPSKVLGQGMLMKTGGIYDIVAASAGAVKDVYFQPGDIVKRGQIVARIEQPDILNKLKEARAALQDLEHRGEQVKTFGSEETRLESESIEQQRVNLTHAVADDEQRIKWLEERIESQQKLLDEGLITKEQLLASRQDLNTTNQRIRASRNEMQQLEVKAAQLNAKKEKDLTSIQQQIDEAKRKITGLQEDLNDLSKLISPYTGRILEVGVDQGSLVARGQSVAKIEMIGEDIKNLEAVLYFPAGEGKKIKPGMTAQVAPSTVEQSEYGYMLGLVTSVSEYPSTYQVMMLTLQNENLVRQLMAGGAPIEVHVDLIPSPSTPSGYKWTSSKGPNVKLQTGTICKSNVTVEKQKPINLVVPILKKRLLGIGEEEGKGLSKL